MTAICDSAAVVDLPEGLRATGFALPDALELGMSRGRLRSRALVVPFRGARALQAPTSSRERALAFAPLLRPWQCLAGISALAVLGLPIPRRLAGEEAVDVLSEKGRSFPVRDGVRVRRMAADRIETREVDGVLVASPALLWALMALRCTEHELVRIGDAVVTDADNYPDLRVPGPLATLAELRGIAEQWPARQGGATLRRALPRVRERVESPRETDMRLYIVDAGMPEPEIQVTVHDPATGRRLGRADLMHADARVVEEYEGAQHRSKEQWDRDIEKYREFERIGLHVVRATNRDFVPTPDAWLAGLAATLRRRTASHGVSS